MKKIILIILGLLMISIFLIGCTKQAKEVISEEMAIEKLMEAGCFWDLSNEHVSINFVDPNWKISKSGCLGVCTINAKTEEISIDVNEMCMGVIPP